MISAVSEYQPVETFGTIETLKQMFTARASFLGLPFLWTSKERVEIKP
jgi:hypothetical protein